MSFERCFGSNRIHMGTLAAYVASARFRPRHTRAGAEGADVIDRGGAGVDAMDDATREHLVTDYYLPLIAQAFPPPDYPFSQEDKRAGACKQGFDAVYGHNAFDDLVMAIREHGGGPQWPRGGGRRQGIPRTTEVDRVISTVMKDVPPFMRYAAWARTRIQGLSPATRPL